MTTVHKEDGIQLAVVDLSIIASPDSPFRFRTSEAIRNTARIEDLTGEQCPDDLIDRAIAAVQSGVFFAAKRTGIMGIEVIIQHLRGYVGESGFTGFALAASLEVFRLCAPHVQLDEKYFEAWSAGKSSAPQGRASTQLSPLQGDRYLPPDTHNYPMRKDR